MKTWFVVCLMMFGIVSTSVAQNSPIALTHSRDAGLLNWSDTYLVTSDGFSVYLWDRQTGALVTHFEDITAPVFYVGFNPDGTRLYWVGFDDFHIIDIASGKELAAIGTGYMEPQWSADGSRLLGVAAGDDGGASNGVAIWDTETWDRLLSVTLPGEVDFVEWNADETRLLVLHQTETDDWLMLLDASTGDVIAEPGAVNAVALFDFWSPDKQAILAASHGASATEIQVWGSDKGALLRTMTAPVNYFVRWYDATTLEAFPRRADDEVIFLDALTGESVATPALYSAFLSPNGTKALRPNADLTGYDLMNAADGSIIASFFVPVDRFDRLPFPIWSPDSRRFAFILDNRIQVRDGNTGAITSVLQSDDPEPYRLYWRPDGQALVVVYVENPIMRLWTDF